MYLILDKTSHTVWNYDTEIEYQANGYPCLLNEKVAYPDWGVDVKEVAELPKSVEPMKYCYTEEDGIYENPNYVEPPENPYGITDELLEQIETNYRERLAQEVSEHGYDA